jgi:anti-sigma factor ChrR (cupin superfamily)
VNLSEETLMAYVDGELDGSTREQVARAVAADPEVARRVAAHQALRGKLRAGFDPVLEEPVPARLLSLVHSAHSGAQPAQVLPLRTRLAPQRSWVQWSSLAASFVLGAVVWHFAMRLTSSGPITENQGEFVASGALEKALDGQLAADQEQSAAVQMGVSFISRQGPYCRTFRLRGSADAAGLACHENQRWTVQVLAHEPASQAPGQYRQAASDMAPAVLRAVTDSIAGDPLDAAAEAQARASGWRVTAPH